MRYDTLRKIKANLVQKLDEYEYEHTVTGGIARLAFELDDASRKYIAIKNRCVAAILIADSPEAVVAALMSMVAKLQGLDKNKAIPFGYFENYATQVLQQFTSRETDPYFYSLLSKSGLKTYFGSTNQLKTLQTDKQHNHTYRKDLYFNAEAVSQFFSAFDEKTLSSLTEEQRSQYVIPILTEKDLINAIASLVLEVLKNESNKWFPSSSNIDTFSKTLEQALTLMNHTAPLGVDFKQSLMQTMSTQYNLTNKSKKLDAFFRQVTSVLDSNTSIPTASSAPAESLSLYEQLRQRLNSGDSSPRSQTTSESILPADPYQIRALPTGTAVAIEDVVNVDPNDIIMLYNLSRNNFRSLGSSYKKLQEAAEKMRLDGDLLGASIAAKKQENIMPRKKFIVRGCIVII